MYTEHESFNPPPRNAILWRYMDFTKFVSFLDSSALFFTRADKLGDPFEGMLSRKNYELEHLLYPQVSRGSIRNLHNSLIDFRRFHAVNCWHWNNYESAAMWTLYGQDQGGIAIKTSFDSLADSFTDPINIYIGQVSYVDYNNTFIPEENTFSAYLHKRKSFEHEREIRAIIEGFPQFDNDTVYINSDLPDTWEIGRPCTVDLNTLVHEIIISPLTPNWIFDLVQSVVAKYGLSLPVSRSSIAETPHERVSDQPVR